LSSAAAAASPDARSYCDYSYHISKHSVMQSCLIGLLSPEHMLFLSFASSVRPTYATRNVYW